MLYTQGKTDCAPADIGYNEERLEVLKNHFHSLVEDNQIYCATYCLSRKGKVFAHGGVGYKTYKKDASLPVSPTNVHYIASMTKTFTGIAIMKLVEDGITRLDVTAGSILPQFDSPPFNGITLFHLLTHTSGMHADGGCFPNKHNDGGYWNFIYSAYQAFLNDKSKDKGEKEFDWIAAALAYGVRMEPDREWAYCSFGYVILGEIIHKLTGVHAHKYIEDNICKPLGLTDTAFDITAQNANRYIIHDEEAEEYVKNTLNGVPEKREEPWCRMPGTGGAMVSTVWDIVRYGNMVLHGGTFDGVRIMGRKAVEKMTAFAIQKPDYCWGSGGKIRGYGIGFDHRNGPAFSFSDSTVMHEGAGACALYVDPEEDFVAAWISPFVDRAGWCQKAMYSTVNVIWSGFK